MRTSPGTSGTKVSFSRVSVLNNFSSDTRRHYRVVSAECCVLSRSEFSQRFGDHAVFGMVHLRALPGAPLFGGSLDSAISAALLDARALATGGCAGLVFENFGDRPFYKRVSAETVAAMTRVIAEVAR